MSAQQQQLQQVRSHIDAAQLDTCLNHLPNVQCRVDRDCQQWMQVNCSTGDRAITRAKCDMKEGKYDSGVCAFMSLNRDPTIYGGS